MHIALITENIAERKHLERLLDRCNDSLSETGSTIYTESYGDATHLWSVVHRYNVFILDYFDNIETMQNIINRLFDLNLNGKIIVCQPEEEWARFTELPEDVFTIQKPITQNNLNNLIKQLQQDFLESRVPTIELRGENETLYVPVSEIMYAIRNGHRVDVYLSDNSAFTILASMTDFARDLVGHTQFTSYAKKGFSFNEEYVKEKTGATVTMTTGYIFKLPLIERSLKL